MKHDRYEGVRRVLDLALALQTPGRGLCLDEIGSRYAVGRRTAERMRAVVAALFPDLHFETGPDGKRYWKLRRGLVNGLAVWNVNEIVALEAAVRSARDTGRHDHERALRSVAEKVKALIGPWPSNGAGAHGARGIAVERTATSELDAGSPPQ